MQNQGEEHNFLNRIVEDNIEILALRPISATVILFSNAGRGGKRNWFVITTAQILSCLEDIRSNIDSFPTTYNEKQWRGLFSEHLCDDVARTLGATQTLPMFEILAKTIHFANSSGARVYKVIDLTPDALDRAITSLSNVKV
ncbi:hypothetical protein [Pseudochrobactrum sp. B5]|uniref:hypothetical protein n=1 Tax=Pseudochrobactrum sp. B5 TaxID=1289478 RepID=UPI0009530EB6|nr:hypothetical protein [Pseudochrobactrum sp. B5]